MSHRSPAAFAPRILFSPNPHREPDLREALPDWPIAFGWPTAATAAAFDLVVPLDLDGIRHLNIHARELHGHKALVPACSVLSLCDDKLRFAKVLQRLGFGRYVPALDPAGSGPVVLKPRHGEWGDGIRVLHDAAARDAVAPLLRDGSHYLQAFVPGRSEYVAHVIMRRGRLHYLRCFESVFDRDFHIHGRDCRRTELRDAEHAAHAPLFEAILARIGFEGIGCFNYKLLGKQPQVFEFNPRYGASLSVRAAQALTALLALLAQPMATQARTHSPLRAVR